MSIKQCQEKGKGSFSATYLCAEMVRVQPASDISGQNATGCVSSENYGTLKLYLKEQRFILPNGTSVRVRTCKFGGALLSRYCMHALVSFCRPSWQIGAHNHVSSHRISSSSSESDDILLDVCLISDRPRSGLHAPPLSPPPSLSPSRIR